MSRGFTLIELIVVIAIITVLSGIILFSVSQYINKGKDSNISASLAVLVPAGEVFYNAENSANGDGYNGFCDVDKDSVIKNTALQMPQNVNGSCYSISMPASGNVSGNPAGVCCSIATPNYDAWAACAREFTSPSLAYCVDSRGVKKEICKNSCKNNITVCPDDDITSCP